jgi:hypothetical protein
MRSAAQIPPVRIRAQPGGLEVQVGPAAEPVAGRPVGQGAAPVSNHRRCGQGKAISFQPLRPLGRGPAAYKTNGAAAAMFLYSNWLDWVTCL